MNRVGVTATEVDEGVRRIDVITHENACGSQLREETDELVVLRKIAVVGVVKTYVSRREFTKVPLEAGYRVLAGHKPKRP